MQLTYSVVFCDTLKDYSDTILYFRVDHISGMHLIFPKMRLFDLFTNHVPVFNISRTTVTVSAKNAKKIKVCGIMDLKVHKEILKSDLETGYLNKSVKFVLSKNIRVPEVALFCDFTRIRRGIQHTDFNRKVYANKLPTDMKVGSYSPKDKFIIQENTKTLLDELQATKKTEEVFTDLFMKEDVEYYTEKLHILGLYFSQGMKDIRLPCEVFLYARSLHLSNKEQFTKEEDEIIINFIKNKSSNTPWSDLSKMLDRTSKSVQSRFIDILQHSDKTTNIHQRYSNHENEQILEALFDSFGHNLNDIKITNKNIVWKQLGEKFNRRPNNIYNHWYQFILPHLIHYEAGVMEVDFKESLIDYCVDNNIMFAQEANWQEIVKNPQFVGTTASYLSSIYRDVRGLTKRKLKKTSEDIEDHEITTKTMQKYLAEKKPHPRRRTDIEYLVSSYEELRRSRNSK